MSKIFTPHVCEHCNQTTNYDLGLDKGSAMIVIAFANAVRRLSRNCIHITSDMLGRLEEGGSLFELIKHGWMTPSMEKNVTRPRYHGLIAFAEDRGSNKFFLTPKGAKFLRGEPVKRVAIIDKSKGENAGYIDEGGEITISELISSGDPLWEGIEAAKVYLGRPEMTMKML